MNNRCVATYLSILCAKYYENRSTFVKTIQRTKKASVFLEHGVCMGWQSTRHRLNSLELVRVC